MQKRWYTVAEAAEYFSLKKKTVYTLIAKKEFPEDAIIRLGHQIRVDIKRIEEQKGTIDARIGR